jgi:TPR repeat protein
MLKKPDMEKAIRIYKIGAKQGYGHSQYVVGKFYYTGEGVDKNHKMALYWLEQASQQDVAPAMYYLGKLYADDQSAVFDMEKAASWWMRSLALDNRQESLGLVELELSWCLALGVCVNQFERYEDEREREYSAVEFLFWAKGNIPTREPIAVDEASWWYRYVQRGDAHALYWLGMCYRHIAQLVPPKGGDKNVCMFDCFRKAAEMGHFGAQYAVAEYFYNGPISVRDREEGLRWYRLAAAQGYPDAIEALQEIEATSKKS